MIKSGYAPVSEASSPKAKILSSNLFYYLDDYSAPKSEYENGSANRAFDELNRMLELGKSAYEQKLVSPSYGYLASDMATLLDFSKVHWNENPGTSKLYKASKKLVQEMRNLFKKAQKEGLNKF